MCLSESSSQKKSNKKHKCQIKLLLSKKKLVNLVYGTNLIRLKKMNANFSSAGMFVCLKRGAKTVYAEGSVARTPTSSGSPPRNRPNYEIIGFFKSRKIVFQSSEKIFSKVEGHSANTSVTFCPENDPWPSLACGGKEGSLDANGWWFCQEIYRWFQIVKWWGKRGHFCKVGHWHHHRQLQRARFSKP